MYIGLPPESLSSFLAFKGRYEIFPKCGWVGWLIPKQGPNPSKPLKTPPNHPENRLFRPEFHLSYPKSHKNPGMGGWVNTFGKDIPKKTRFFFGYLPLERLTQRRRAQLSAPQNETKHTTLLFINIRRLHNTLASTARHLE